MLCEREIKRAPRGGCSHLQNPTTAVRFERRQETFSNKQGRQGTKRQQLADHGETTEGGKKKSKVRSSFLVNVYRLRFQLFPSGSFSAGSPGPRGRRADSRALFFSPPSRSFKSRGASHSDFQQVVVGKQFLGLQPVFPAVPGRPAAAAAAAAVAAAAAAAAAVARSSPAAASVSPAAPRPPAPPLAKLVGGPQQPPSSLDQRIAELANGWLLRPMAKEGRASL
ncbi:uncharacterized protein LOC130043165 [Sorex fumeus]|uniref:uncharacterized protein LOC130043165 n=1 Tax=Sorex fumeus TaxID=62283 RepID=UPI0024ACE406|nr:uncharacterized protein LOC130043165 [Sorex fumeus]